MKSLSVVEAEPLTALDRGSRSIFLCHSGHESQFVPLLEALLEAHDHHSTAVSGDEDLDAREEQQIERMILESDAVLVVVNRHSRLRPWMTRQIAAFHATKPQAPIFSLLLEPVDLDRVMAGLSRFESIEFEASLLGGFERLFEAFGNDFLSKQELRDRRSVDRNRRTDSERRSSTVEQRIQMGFLLQYCRATDESVFERQVVSLRELTVLTTALQEEARRYEYFDGDGLAVDPLEALDRSVIAAWRRMGDRAEQEVATVLKAVAQEICSLFLVRPVERRRKERRS